MVCLRYQADRSTLLTLGVAGCVLAVPLVWDLDTRWSIVLFGLNVFFGLIAHVINHNISHCSLFENEKANRLTSIGVSGLIGVPASAISASHIYNHHVHNNSDSDWLRSTVLAESQGPRRLLKYVWHVFALPRLYQRRGADAIPANLKLQIQQEKIFIGLALLLAVAFAPGVTLFYYISTRLCALSCLFVLNLIQHDGLENEEGVNRCHNYTSKLLNFVLFKNGYHSAHHLRPGAHWSELDALHYEKVSPLANSNLQHKSIVSFVWGNYLRP